MKIEAVILFVSVCLYSEALDCGIHVNHNEKLKSIIGTCLRTNKTLEEMYDVTSMSSESDPSNSSDERNVDDKMAQNFRTRRSVIKNDQQQVEEPQENDKSTSESQESDDNKNNTNGTNGETCIVQCVFNQMNMTDSDGYPDHTKILAGLLQTAEGREFRDFLQDMTNECFQEVKKESYSDICIYSTKVLSCLADRGKDNCEDWPVGNLPLN